MKIYYLMTFLPKLRQRYFLATFVICSLWCMGAIAQFPANFQCTGAGVGVGTMKISATTGCSPLQVLTSNGGSQTKNVKYIYYYKGGVPITTDAIADSVFTYKVPGTYYIMQLSEDAQGKPLRACATVTVKDTIAPNFQLSFCSNGTAKLTLPTDKSNIYDKYNIDWGDGQLNLDVLKNTKNISHKYTDEKTYRVSVTGSHTQGRCSGNAAIKAITTSIVKDSPKITRLELTSATTAELTISNPDLLDLLIYSRLEENNFLSTGKIVRKATEKVLVTVDSSKYMCFKASPMDTCVTKLESNLLCTTVLNTLTIDDTYNLVTIIPYRYPSQVKTVSIMRDDKVWKTLNPTDIWVHDYQPNCKAATCYQVMIETPHGLVVTQSKCLKPPLALCGELGNIFVPDAFTPNGDGHNDFLEVKGDIMKDYQLTIFNSWGTSVFQSNTPMSSWNGTLNGQKLSSGQYFYLLRVKDSTGRTFQQKGTVALLR